MRKKNKNSFYKFIKILLGALVENKKKSKSLSSTPESLSSTPKTPQSTIPLSSTLASVQHQKPSSSTRDFHSKIDIHFYFREMTKRRNTHQNQNFNFLLYKYQSISRGRFTANKFKNFSNANLKS